MDDISKPRVPLALERCACPLCGSMDEGIVAGERGRFGVAVRNVVCRTCGLVFVNPRPGRAAMAEYYASEYRPHFQQQGIAYLSADGRSVEPGSAEYAAETEAWHQNQAQTSFALGGATRGARVFEIGCRHGRTLGIMRERFGIEPHGLEPDLTEAARAKQAGIECFPGVLEDFDPGERLFDVIQIFHVLEHLHDPLDALLRCRRWLVTGGRLVIEVPNVYRPYGALEGNFFQNAHLTSFSPDTLAALLFRAGFTPVHLLDQSVLFAAATPDPRVTDVPRPYEPSACIDPSRDAEWVRSRLASYADLFIQTAQMCSGELSVESVQRVALLLSGPCFTDFALDTLAKLAESLVSRGAPLAATLLAQALAEAPQPDEARAAARHLARELSLLVAAQGRSLTAAH